MKNYFIKLIGLSLLMLLIAFLFQRFAPEKIVSEGIIYLPFIFLIINAVSKIVMLKGKDSEQVKILKNFMIAMSVKFLLYIALMLAYAFIYPHDAVRFILSFFVFYLVYTAFDSIQNHRALREKD
ncbi:MAG: hypothetical protein ACOCWC_00295 [Bacteroidota bacterium]